MAFFPTVTAALGIFLAIANPAAACDEKHFFPSADAALEPLSVPAQNIGAWLTASSASSGIRFASALHGRDLWLDITDFPDRAPEVGSVRALMQLGRVAGEGFDRLLLVNGQEVLFVLNETDLRTVGCQFVWPSNTGADPLMLMRTLIEAIRDEGTGAPMAGLSGSGSMTTTIQAALVVQDSLNPAWVSTARPGNKAPDTPKGRQDEMVGTVAPRVQAAVHPASEMLVLSGL